MLLKLAGFVVGVGLCCLPASAALCVNTTDCTLQFTQGNSSSSIGTGDFGTLRLQLSSNVVTATIDLADNFYIIGTGFPAAIGFNDTVGGALSVGAFTSPVYYAGYSDTDSGSGKCPPDFQFNGFGCFGNAAATTAPSPGSVNALNVLSFTIQKGASISNVNQLLALSTQSGEGPAYWVVDVVKRDAQGNNITTGLIAITGTVVPEPGFYGLLSLGLGGLLFLARRKAV